VSQLLNPATRDSFDKANRAHQAELRAAHAARQERPLLSYAQARANAASFDWAGGDLPVPDFIGRRVIHNLPLAELVPFIDWTFFFAAWELKGRVPKIFEHPEYGHAARELYDHARQLLDQIAKDRRLEAHGVYGFWPAASSGDDIVLYADEARREEIVRFPMLRQQEAIPDRKPNRSLADFVAPIESGRRDYLGAFAVTAGIGADELVAEFERAHDDYNAILVKALADRLAEAFAAYLHARTRREWAFGRDEQVSVDDVIAEKHRGIRPAFGYPACPDHSLKAPLFSLLEAGDAGLQLTETFAMLPAASVSGIYFSHPDARYFTVGRLGRDQVEDYASRQGRPVADVERWLTPNLAYDPSLVPA
jgi:5-methyltetrahydrofolate--homocysteine methyltransferase